SRELEGILAFKLQLTSTNWATATPRLKGRPPTPLSGAPRCGSSPERPLGYGPPIHVNQAGYSPTSQKKAMIRYYLGSLGEMQISTNFGFKLVKAASGSQAYPTNGLATLPARPDDTDSWWPDTTGVHQAQYQQ